MSPTNKLENVSFLDFFESFMEHLVRKKGVRKARVFHSSEWEAFLYEVKNQLASYFKEVLIIGDFDGNVLYVWDNLMPFIWFREKDWVTAKYPDKLPQTEEVFNSEKYQIIFDKMYEISQKYDLFK